MRKRIFFSGQYRGENGPANVNKNIVAFLPGNIARLKSRNRYFMRLEMICKICWCDVFILSAIGHKQYEIKLARLLKRKIIYIMHGFGVDDSPFVHKMEIRLLPHVDKILCVSSPFCLLAQKRYPQYADKMEVLTNGVAWEKIEGEIINGGAKRDQNEVILVGGGREIKRNLIVCEAIEQINRERGMSLHVSVYGRYSEKDDSPRIKKIPCVTYCGLISHNELLKKYQMSRLFIQNSRIESFGLAVVEAIIGGCDVLLSKNVGAIDVISSIQPRDIINDFEDIEEIKEKVCYILDHPNNNRIIHGIDREKTSLRKAAERLLEIAERV